MSVPSACASALSLPYPCRSSEHTSKEDNRWLLPCQQSKLLHAIYVRRTICGSLPCIFVSVLPGSSRVESEKKVVERDGRWSELNFWDRETRVEDSDVAANKIMIARFGSARPCRWRSTWQAHLLWWFKQRRESASHLSPKPLRIIIVFTIEVT